MLSFSKRRSYNMFIHRPMFPIIRLITTGITRVGLHFRLLYHLASTLLPGVVAMAVIMVVMVALTTEVTT